MSPDDTDVAPSSLHPAFHGSVDWHSSAHMQWSAIRLLTLAEDDLRSDTRAELIRTLGERLTQENGRVEAAHLALRSSVERPYGWGWVAMLAAAARSCSLPEATGWAISTGLVADTVADNLMAWMPNLAYPVRHEVHSNTAFAVARCHEGLPRWGAGMFWQQLRTTPDDGSQRTATMPLGGNPAETISSPRHCVKPT